MDQGKIQEFKREEQFSSKKVGEGGPTMHLLGGNLYRSNKQSLLQGGGGWTPWIQRRYDMRHEMLTQRAPFCIGAMAKKGTLSQHFVTHVVPPLPWICPCG